MPTVSVRAQNRLNNILMMVKRMPARQQEELEEQLMRMLMIERAEKLQKSVKGNSITIKEIVEEVRKARDGQ